MPSRQIESFGMANTGLTKPYFQLYDPQRKIERSQASRGYPSHPFNDNIHFQDGVALVEYPIFEEGKVFDVRSFVNEPTQTKNILGKDVTRKQTGLMTSRYAPKPGSKEQVQQWLNADVIEEEKTVEDLAYQYRIAKQRAEARKLAQKFLHIAQTATHPFEIYRNILPIANVVAKPLEGEPGYLPEDIEEECAIEYEKLQVAFIKAKQMGGDCSHLDPYKMPIEMFDFEHIPDVVPDAVYKKPSSVKPTLSAAAKEFVPASTSSRANTETAESSPAVSESGVIQPTAAISALPKKTADNQSPSTMAPQASHPAVNLAKDSNAWLSSNISHPNRSSPAIQIIQQLASKVSTKAVLPVIGFDGHNSSASGKSQPSVKQSVKSSRIGHLAGPDDFFAPNSAAKIFKIQSTASSSMIEQSTLPKTAALKVIDLTNETIVATQSVEKESTKSGGHDKPHDKLCSAKHSEKTMDTKVFPTKSVDLLADPNEALAALFASRKPKALKSNAISGTTQKKLEPKQNVGISTTPSIEKESILPQQVSFKVIESLPVKTEVDTSGSQQNASETVLEKSTDQSDVPAKKVFSSRLAGQEEFMAFIKKPIIATTSQTTISNLDVGQETSGYTTGMPSCNPVSTDEPTLEKTFADKFTVGKSTVGNTTVNNSIVDEIPVGNTLLAPEAPTKPMKVAEPETNSTTKTVTQITSTPTTPTLEFASAEDFMTWISGGTALTIKIASIPMVVNLTGVSITIPTASPAPTTSVVPIPLKEPATETKIDNFPSNSPSVEDTISEKGADLKSEQCDIKIKVEDMSSNSFSEDQAIPEESVLLNNKESIKADNVSPQPEEIYGGPKASGFISPTFAISHGKDPKSNLMNAADFNIWISTTKSTGNKIAPPFISPPPRPEPTFVRKVFPKDSTEKAPYYDLLASPEYSVSTMQPVEKNSDSKATPPVSDVGLIIPPSDGVDVYPPNVIKAQDPNSDPDAKLRIANWVIQVDSKNFKPGKVDVSNPKFCSKDEAIRALIIANIQFLEELEHPPTEVNPNDKSFAPGIDA